MKLTGTATINAPRDKVWAVLTNPHAVGACVPGLEAMDIVEPDKRFKATAMIGFGTVSVRFVTDVEWTQINAPDFASMKAHGDGSGSAADVTAELTLTDAENGATQLAWVADVTVVGTIASLASRLLPSVSNLLTSMFFNCVQKQIEGGSPS
jgi:hypothetical protein